METNGEIKGRYIQLESDRSVILNEGVRMAELTIPSLILPQGSGKNYEPPVPYQSLGSRGVNQLASKLLLALFPAVASFFRLNVGDGELERLGATERGEVERGLSQIEKQVCSFIDNKGIRIQIFEAIKQLLVVGNVLLYFQDDESMRLFKLDSYVVSRDSSGNVMQIITKEKIMSNMLDPKLKNKYNIAMNKDVAVVEPNPVGIENEDKEYVLPEELELYTLAERVDTGKWRIVQELNGVEVDDDDAKSGFIRNDEFPFIPLCYVRTGTDNYARGFVHEHQGDLYSYEGMSKAIYEMGMAAARTIYLKRPGSVLDMNQLRDAPNLSVLQGTKDDIHVIESGKGGDARITQETYMGIEKRLNAAFLLNTSVQRNAERVSAEEIKLLAQELEQSLGGMHSVLSQQLQLPIIKYVLSRLAKKGKIKKLPEEIQPKITTGIEAFGRTKDFEALMTFCQSMVNLLSPPVFMAEVNASEIIKRGVTSLGIDPLGLLKSEEQKAQDQEQAQEQAQEQMMAEMASKAAPNMVNAMAQQPQQSQQPQTSE